VRLLVSYTHFIEKNPAYLSHIAGGRTLLKRFNLKIAENPSQAGLSIKDKLFIYITKSSRSNWLQVQPDLTG
jgi:hypothetical protein